MQTQTLTRHDGGAAQPTDWRDAACAAVAAVLAFGVYLRTLAPGLVGVYDTPMFQFIGRVLGVPHNPGYPLYVLLTFPFSYLPIGSLAYRINLFSAVLGATAAALTFFLARQLDCRRLAAFVAALGLAFGQVFWSQSVIAEVYTLHAAIIVAVLLALVVWARTGRAAYYYLSVALFAAGLGNHITIVGFAPGIAIFVVLTNRTFAFCWRTIALTLAILTAGLLQYVFILIRSLDPDAYVESRATTVGALLDVMLAGQFRDRLFAFGWRTVVFDRFPFLFQRVLVPELTLPALGLAIVGALWLLRRRLRAALLLLSGMTAILGFAVNYSVVDTPVFMIPAILVLWVLAAVGVERTARLAERASHAHAGALVTAAALVLPGWLLVHNFAPNDQSREYTSATYLEALFGILPDRSALVHEDFLIDRMVMSKLLDEEFPKSRRIDLVDRDDDAIREVIETGRSVFAFNKSARRLRYEALDFSFAPVPLTGRTLDEFQSHIPVGSAVIIAVPAAHASQFAATGASLAVVGGTSAADRTLDAGRQIGDSQVLAPAAIELHADVTGAAIRLGGRDLVRTFDGVAVVVFTPEGKVDDAFVLRADTKFRMPLSIGPLSIYRLRGPLRGRDFDDRSWSDITAVCRTGSVMLRVPPGQTSVLYVGDDRPLEPRAFDKSQDRISTHVSEVAPGFGAAGHLYRLEIGASGGRAVSVLLAFGGIPTQAFARVSPSGTRDHTATIFMLDTAGLLRRPDRRSEVLLMARDEQSQLIGDGWSTVDFDVVGPYRWMTASESMLVMPVTSAGATHIRLHALRQPAAGGPTMIAVRLNQVRLPAQPMEQGWRAYEWQVPAGALHDGTNEMAVTVDRLPNGKAVAVADTRLERQHD